MGYKVDMVLTPNNVRFTIQSNAKVAFVTAFKRRHKKWKTLWRNICRLAHVMATEFTAVRLIWNNIFYSHASTLCFGRTQLGIHLFLFSELWCNWRETWRWLVQRERIWFAFDKCKSLPELRKYPLTDKSDDSFRSLLLTDSRCTSVQRCCVLVLPFFFLLFKPLNYQWQWNTKCCANHVAACNNPVAK
jgi:hypothetical protein